MTLLTPLARRELRSFRASGRSCLRRRQPRGWALERHEAGKLAAAKLRELLPQGHATPDHFLYEMRAAPDGPVVGYVWFSAERRGDTRIAFLYQLLVLSQYRRRGHARAAMAALEAIAQEQGLARICLNVFASNAAAHALYRSLGYVETNLSMQRMLPRD